MRWKWQNRRRYRLSRRSASVECGAPTGHERTVSEARVAHRMRGFAKVKGTEPLGTSSRDGQGPDEFRFDFVRGLTSPGKGHITRAPPFDRLRRRPDRYCVQSRAPFPSSQKAVAGSGR
jgi:hypothetical protein